MITDEMVERFAASYFPCGKTYSPDLVRAALEAAIGDMVLVPREPTRSMVDAGMQELAWSDRVRQIWRLMLYAAESSAITASQPPGAGEGREGGDV